MAEYFELQMMHLVQINGISFKKKMLTAIVSVSFSIARLRQILFQYSPTVTGPEPTSISANEKCRKFCWDISWNHSFKKLVCNITGKSFCAGWLPFQKFLLVLFCIPSMEDIVIVFRIFIHTGCVCLSHSSC